MLELTTQSFIEIKVDGVVYKGRKPTQGDLESLEEQLAKSEGKMAAKVFNEYLASLDFPIEMIRKLPADQTLLLVQELNGQKKS